MPTIKVYTYTKMGKLIYFRHVCTDINFMALQSNLLNLQLPDLKLLYMVKAKCHNSNKISQRKTMTTTHMHKNKKQITLTVARGHRA